MVEKNHLEKMIRTAIVTKLKQLGVNKFKEFKVINEVPELTVPLTDLLSSDFPQFVKDIEWVSPKPRSFRVILENEQSFYLTDLTRSWVAEIEGKKYYLLNLAESERAATAISRVLRYAKPTEMEGGAGASADSGGGFTGGGEAEFPGSEPAAGGAEAATEEAPEEIAPGFEEFEELPG
jgi:hypothetical protein